ncbi:MAG: VWA domain-containing protein [Sulfitobacter sp.]
MKRLRTAVLATSLSILTTSLTAAPSDIMFVLDGSGSMWGQIGGIAKIQTAKETMQKLLEDVPAEARLGLMTYGTQSKASCSDVSVLNAIGAPRDEIKTSLNDLTPLGKTPIGNSLLQALSLLEKAEPSDAQKSLVLVSDGIETCDSDPCAIANKVKEIGVNIKVHVVGFDVDDAARAQLECIANNGNGQYFDASDTDGFKRAMDQVVQVSQNVVEEEAEPEPTPPADVEVFRDDFDGDDLADHWTIYNPDPDSYIVEDGQLLVVSASVAGFTGDETVQNRFDLDFEMPKGDWDVDVEFEMDSQDFPQEGLFVGSAEGRNPIYALFASGAGTYDSKSVINVRRESEGKELVGQSVNVTNEFEFTSSYAATTREKITSQKLKMTWSKRGRDYTSSITLLGEDGEEMTLTTDPVTQLRGPKSISMLFNIYWGIGKTGPSKGDSTILIDSLSIKSIGAKG